MSAQTNALERTRPRIRHPVRWVRSMSQATSLDFAMIAGRRACSLVGRAQITKKRSAT
jgi:hypothetical protein